MTYFLSTAASSGLILIAIAGGICSLIISSAAILKGADLLLGHRIDNHQTAILAGQKAIETKVDQALAGLASTKLTDERQDAEIKAHGERLAWVEGTLGKPLHSTKETTPHVVQPV